MQTLGQRRWHSQRRRAAFLVAIGLVLHGYESLAGDTTNETSATDTNASIQVVRDRAVKVFIDGAAGYQDYLRSEIAFVNFLRERDKADVHILITTAGSGGGGVEFTLLFAGKKNFSDLNYTLKYLAPVNATEDDTRRGLRRILEDGLMPFVARTPLAEFVSIKSSSVKATDVVLTDPWDSWVFGASVSGAAVGEKQSQEWSMSWGLNASRVTEASKVSLNFSAWDDHQTYDIDSNTVDAVLLSRSAGAQQVWSLGDHFSAGLSGNWYSSTRDNIRSQFGYGPAAEYNWFPYRDYAKHELSLYYQLHRVDTKYDEETVYGKTDDDLWQHYARVAFILKKEWGSLSTSFYYQSYVEDASLYALGFNSSVSVSMGKGFAFNVYGGYSLIHDQIGLALEGATTEEILLQLKSQETDYSFNAGAGVSYTFGSIYNNVVNTRF